MYGDAASKPYLGYLARMIFSKYCMIVEGYVKTVKRLTFCIYVCSIAYYPTSMNHVLFHSVPLDGVSLW
jgi:hypothetical protein